MVGFGKALAAQLEAQPEWREVGEQGSSEGVTTWTGFLGVHAVCSIPHDLDVIT